MANLEDAIALACEKHRGQPRKSNEPYILHPLRVMFRCRGEVDRIVAVLHDIVEDTTVTLDDLRARGLSEDVVAAVDHLTKRPGESYEQFIDRAARNPIARRVKLADLADNMDVRELPAFGPKDAERMARYVAAWRKLGGDAP